LSLYRLLSQNDSDSQSSLEKDIEEEKEMIHYYIDKQVRSTFLWGGALHLFLSFVFIVALKIFEMTLTFIEVTFYAN